MLLAPERIAALSPLARDPALSYFAREARRFPVVRPSAEAVLALRPGLVLGGKFGARATLSLLERAGVRVERLDVPTDFPSLRAGLRAAGALLGVPERAETAIAAMDAAMPPPVSPPSPPMTALVWRPRGWTSGPGGMMDAVLRAAGLTNAGTGARAGLEALTRHQPDILIIGESGAGVSLATEMLRHRAVRNVPVRFYSVSLEICPGPWTVRTVGEVGEGGERPPRDPTFPTYGGRTSTE